ncbi:small s protein [Paraphaeosphaeria sporulosa]
MDPATAFALAASILQVVDFSKNVLSTGYQLYQNGSTLSNSDFMFVADDLSTLNDKIKTFARPDLSVSGPLAAENQALGNLASELQKIVDELIIILLRIRNKGERTVFRSFRQAIVTIWNKSKIEETVKRMDSIREEVQFHLIVSMIEKVDRVEVKEDASLQSLDNATKSIVESILQGKVDLADILATQTSRFMEREDAREAAAIERHNDISAKLDQLTQQPVVELRPQGAVGKEIEKDILRNIKLYLSFSIQEDRYDTIKTAHETTFEWIFDGSNKRDAPWDNLNDWLRSNSSLYWISGKAGSGKSTLVKFLAEDNRFRAALELWAGEIPLIIASYYFWNSGENLQKSQEGLLRTLLLKVVEQQPSLAPVLFPDRYEEPKINWRGSPTLPQLRRALGKLMTQTVGVANVILVVDGLDEFDPTDASYVDLADMFITASQSPNIKVLLSSRPLSAFEASFAHYPKLRLHELTRIDIETFVNDRLRRHRRIADLSEEDARGVEALISEIVSASSGVFFWVKLAVDLLLEGFRNFDTLEDLHYKLKTIPRDLDDLFTRMLRQIPKEYKFQSSKIFQILRCMDGHAQLASTSEPGGCEKTASVLHFAEIDVEKVLRVPIFPASPMEQERFNKEIEGRLRSRCAGLVELSSVFSMHGKERPYDGSHKQRFDFIWVDRRVDYLHRSVADWIQKKHIWDEISAHTAHTSFEPSVSVLQSLVVQMKCFPVAEVDRDRFLLMQRTHVNAALTFAKQAERSTGQAQVALLNELNNVMEHHTGRPRMIRTPLEDSVQTPWESSSWCESIKINEGYIRPTHWHDDFLALTIRHGLNLYVQSTLEAHGDTLPNKKGRPYLDYACNPGLFTGWQPEGTQEAIVKALLEHGADPNELFDRSSPWHTFLCHPRVPRTQEVSIPWLNIVKLLVEHGADIDTHVHEVNFQGSVSEAIRHFFEKVEWIPAAQRAEVLDYAEELEKLSVRVQGSAAQTADSTNKMQDVSSQKGSSGYIDVRPIAIVTDQSSELIGCSTSELPRRDVQARELPDGATDKAKAAGVEGNLTGEKAGKDKSVKRSGKLSLRRIFKR